MDTNTVNFAINKMTAGWNAAVPTLVNMGEKFVKYTVMQEILHVIISVVCMVLSFILFLIFFNGARKSKFTSDVYGGGSVICAVLFVGALAFTMVQGYEAALAYTNPEMFTIQKVMMNMQGSR